MEPNLEKIDLTTPVLQTLDFFINTNKKMTWMVIASRQIVHFSQYLHRYSTSIVTTNLLLLLSIQRKYEFYKPQDCIGSCYLGETTSLRLKKEKAEKSVLELKREYGKISNMKERESRGREIDDSSNYSTIILKVLLKRNNYGHCGTSLLFNTQTKYVKTVEVINWVKNKSDNVPDHLMRLTFTRYDFY